jgi:hypothetical protein
MIANVLQDRVAAQKESQARNAFREFTDMFTAFRLLVVADRIESAERARMLKQG